jgi:threonine/homoserine/homoserine lactone efflux protein
LIESIITISVVGLLVGFVGSMPIAGPISILITTNALKGALRYCNLVTLGASFADFIYVFAAVFGLTKFYSLYKPLIPYVLLVGTFFLLYLGYKIATTKIDLKEVPKKELAEKKKRNGFLTGFLLNFLNPTLFISWLTTTVIVISIVSSMGFNTEGFDRSVDNSFNAINKQAKINTLKTKTIPYLQADAVENKIHQPSVARLSQLPKYFPLLLSSSYALFLAVGGIAWFFLLAFLLAKYRQQINIHIVNKLVQVLGVVLCLFGIFMGYKSVLFFIGKS